MGADQARDLLAGQLAQPVEFIAQIEAMYRMGARTFLEVGPDAKLTGLVRSILDGRDHVALAVDATRGATADGNLADLAVVLANLAALGYPVALCRWDEGYQAPVLDRSRKRLTVKVSGANPGPSGVIASGKEVTHRPIDNASHEPTMIPQEPDRHPAPTGIHRITRWFPYRLSASTRRRPLWQIDRRFPSPPRHQTRHSWPAPLRSRRRTCWRSSGWPKRQRSFTASSSTGGQRPSAPSRACWNTRSG